MKEFKEIPQSTYEKNSKVFDSARTSKEFLEKIFSKEQIELLESESEIEKISLDNNGKIIRAEIIEEFKRDDFKDWKNKEGVIDVGEFNNILVVIYNANEKIPDGCPDLRKRNHAGHIRSGEYYPDTKICFVDLSGSWDFLNDHYNPSWIEEYVRHELRHGLVDAEDEKYGVKTGGKARRNLDWEYLKKNNPEEARGLAYIDELHSQYFDALEGAIEGKDCFRKIESRFYSVAGEGPHLKIAAETLEGKKATEDMFYHLQGMLLLKRMTESKETAFKDEIENLTKAAGISLATERSITDAKDKVKLIWNKIISNSAIKEEFDKFIEKYKPSYLDNTPEITGKLKKVLGIN